MKTFTCYRKKQKFPKVTSFLPLATIHICTKLYFMCQYLYIYFTLDQSDGGLTDRESHL